jgi:hypothetical protein
MPFALRAVRFALLSEHIIMKMQLAKMSAPRKVDAPYSGVAAAPTCQPTRLRVYFNECLGMEHAR